MLDDYIYTVFADVMPHYELTCLFSSGKNGWLINKNTGFDLHQIMARVADHNLRYGMVSNYEKKTNPI